MGFGNWIFYALSLSLSLYLSLLNSFSHTLSLSLLLNVYLVLSSNLVVCFFFFLVVSFLHYFSLSLLLFSPAQIYPSNFILLFLLPYFLSLKIKVYYQTILSLLFLELNKNTFINYQGKYREWTWILLN